MQRLNECSTSRPKSRAMGRTSRPTKTGMLGDVRGEACFALLNRNIGCSAVSHSAAGIAAISMKVTAALKGGRTAVVAQTGQERSKIGYAVSEYMGDAVGFLQHAVDEHE